MDAELHRKLYQIFRIRQLPISQPRILGYFDTSGDREPCHGILAFLPKFVDG